LNRAQPAREFGRTQFHHLFGGYGAALYHHLEDRGRLDDVFSFCRMAQAAIGSTTKLIRGISVTRGLLPFITLRRRIATGIATGQVSTSGEMPVRHSPMRKRGAKEILSPSYSRGSDGMSALELENLLRPYCLVLPGSRPADRCARPKYCRLIVCRQIRGPIPSPCSGSVLVHGVDPKFSYCPLPRVGPVRVQGQPHRSFQ
jgi:hypothetical protein